MKKIKLILVLFLLFITSCSSNNEVVFKVGEFSKSGVSNYEVIKKQKDALSLEELMQKDEFGSINLVAADLSNYNLIPYANDLSNVSFSTKTKWGAIPSNFDPDAILENAKKVGLSISDLHEQGIKGDNVGVAMIDAQLLTEHVEYSEQLQMYYSNYTSSQSNRASFHGCAMASIILGKNVGIAPNADLYYIADKCADQGSSSSELIKQHKEYIERIIELNKTLDDNKKIRVISITNGYDEEADNYQEIVNIIKQAEKENIFVCTSDVYDEYFGNDLKLKQNQDIDDINSYELDQTYLNDDYISLPTSGKTFASANGTHEYEYGNFGGVSTAIAYISGLYALSCQVYPDLNFDIFIDAIYETCNQIEMSGETINVVNPVQLIELLKQK